MRMAELSRRSGVSAPTIRFYIREGLVPPGELTSPNQAIYTDEQLRALRLVRALIDIGGLSVERARTVLAHLVDVEDDPYLLLGKVQYAVTPPRTDVPADALERVDRLVADRDWEVRPDSPARSTLAHALVTLDAIGHPASDDLIEMHASTAEQLAEQEVDLLLRSSDSVAAVTGVIAIDVVGDGILSALRRLAQENAVTRRTRSAARPSESSRAPGPPSRSDEPSQSRRSR